MIVTAEQKAAWSEEKKDKKKCTYCLQWPAQKHKKFFFLFLGFFLQKIAFGVSGIGCQENACHFHELSKVAQTRKKGFCEFFKREFERQTFFFSEKKQL